MKWQDLGQYPTELKVTSLFCKVGLYYSSAAINQLFNTKHSFWNLLSRKGTLKCEVLFKKNSIFYKLFHMKLFKEMWNVKLTREILNLDSKIKHLSPVYEKRHRKTAQTTAKLLSSESKKPGQKTNRTRPNPVPKSLFLCILDMVPSAKILSLCTYL